MPRHSFSWRLSLCRRLAQQDLCHGRSIAGSAKTASLACRTLTAMGRRPIAVAPGIADMRVPISGFRPHRCQREWTFTQRQTVLCSGYSTASSMVVRPSTRIAGVRGHPPPERIAAIWFAHLPAPGAVMAKGHVIGVSRGGNVVVIRHFGIPGVFATRYDHFRTGSITVKPGQRVSRGQVLGKVGSAGRSSGPHLHFEVWGSTWYEPVDPWSGVCSPRRGASLWQRPEAPWIR